MKLSEIREEAEIHANWEISKPIKVDSVDETGILMVDGIELQLTPNAFEQLLRRHNIWPNVSNIRKYFPHDEESRLQILSAIDFAMRHKKAVRLIFDGDDIVHGVVGKRYKMVKHLDVLDAVEASLFRKGYDFNNVDERFSYINDSHMKLTFTAIDDLRSPETGEAIGTGSHIWNSDVGLGSLGWSQYFVFVICSNGLFSRKEFQSVRFNHNRQEIVEDYMGSLDKMLSDKSINKFLDWVDKASLKHPLVDVPGQMIPLLKRFRVKKQFHEPIVKFFNEDQDRPLNGFGIGSAVNGYASNTEGIAPDDAIELATRAASIMAIGVSNPW